MEDISDLAYIHLRDFYHDIDDFDDYITKYITYRILSKSCILFRDKVRDIMYVIKEENKNEYVIYKGKNLEIYVNKGEMKYD